MRVKVIEIKETIRELPDNYFDNKDYDMDDLSDCEIASHFEAGKKLWEDTTLDDISWDTRVFNYETNEWEEL